MSVRNLSPERAGVERARSNRERQIYFTEFIKCAVLFRLLITPRLQKVQFFRCTGTHLRSLRSVRSVGPAPITAAAPASTAPAASASAVPPAEAPAPFVTPQSLLRSVHLPAAPPPGPGKPRLNLVSTGSPREKPK